MSSPFLCFLSWKAAAPRLYLGVLWITLGVSMETNTTLESHCRLIFNVATPSFEEAWLEGYDACEEGQEDEGNPYPANSREYRYWSDGWWASFYGEEALFTLSGDINPRAISNKKAFTPEKESFLRRLLHLGRTLFAAVSSYALIENVI
ncbi:MAG: transmission trait enhancer LetE [Gammaproteobacteria bacterium]|nr:transmission trait enhancer LetE [Gammaproteobacteria bacterium]